MKENDIEESVKVLLQSGIGQVSSVFQDTKAVARQIYGPHAVTLVAKKKGKIIGIIHGIATLQPAIVFLGVTDPESAKENLGSILVDRFLEQVKNQFPNVNAVRTTLPADYADAVGFYSSKGFVVEGFVKEAAQGRDMVFLKKLLARRTTPVA